MWLHRRRALHDLPYLKSIFATQPTARYGLVYLVFTEVEAGVELELHFITARRAEPWMVEEYEENRRKR